jgi:hypothetical protein
MNGTGGGLGAPFESSYCAVTLRAKIKVPSAMAAVPETVMNTLLRTTGLLYSRSSDDEVLLQATPNPNLLG